MRIKHLGLMLAASTAAAAVVAVAAAAAPAATASPAPAVVTHQVTGCGKPMTSYTPRVPGAALVGMPGQPSGPGTVLGRANADHATWVTWTRCIPRPGEFGAHYSPNWAGYEDRPTAAQWQINPYIQAYWTIPNAGPLNAKGDTDHSAAWVGVGSGANGGQLLQSGTEQDSLPSGKSYYFWGESYPYQSQWEVPPATLKATPGHDIGSATYYDNGVATFTFCDYTTDYCAQGSEDVPAGPSRQAEWIVERTSECQSGEEVLPYLAKFGKVVFTDGSFGVTSEGTVRYDIGEGDPELWTITPTGSSANPMTLTTALTSPGENGFTTKWKSYGKPYSLQEIC